MYERKDERKDERMITQLEQPPSHLSFLPFGDVAPDGEFIIGLLQ
jgi:hypothetical protein